MAFDVLRTYHAVDAKIDEQGIIKRRIRWKPCKPGAKAFPGWHSYGSAVWEPHPEDWIKGPGVESGPLIYSNGKGYVPPGVEFHGPQEWFENGIPSNKIAELTSESSQGECWPPVEAIESMGKPIEPSLCPIDWPLPSTVRWLLTNKTGRFAVLPDTFDTNVDALGICQRIFGEFPTFGGELFAFYMTQFLESGVLSMSIGFYSPILGGSYTWEDATFGDVESSGVGGFLLRRDLSVEMDLPFPCNFATLDSGLGDRVSISLALV